MITPVRYGDHEPLTYGTACAVCRNIPTRPTMDHCHEHGWVRGPICHSCNLLMAQVDRGSVPLAETLASRVIELSTLLMQRSRCEECAGIPWSGPDAGRRRVSYTSVTVDHAASAELRLYAAQLAGRLGKRITLTDAVRVATAVASTHLTADGVMTATALGITEPTRKVD